MALSTCGGCGTRFAIGLLRCPRCGTVAPLYADRVTTAPAPMAGEHGPELAGLGAGAYVEMPFKQLRAAAKARGLSAAGTAEALRARILEHDRAEDGRP
jgi:hypothetical protein